MPEIVMTVEAGLPGTAEIPSLPDSTYRVSARTSGFWTPGAVLKNDDSEVTLLDFFPAEKVLGSITIPRNAARPEEMVLYLEPVGPRSTGVVQALPDRFQVRCPVNEEGSWLCVVPTGVFDLKVKAPGFAADYFWEHRVLAGEVLDLGAIQLRAGSSVVGRVETADGEPVNASCRVTLQNLAALEEGFIEDQSLRSYQQTARVDQRGFFHFTGLEAGGYLLTAEQQGYAKTPEVRLSVLEGVESSLRRPLQLQRPSRVEVLVQPPLDFYHRPWRVRLSPRENRATIRAASGPVSDSGQWIAERLPAGSYRLVVENHRGDRWYSEDVELESPETFLFVSLSALRIRGSFSVGGKPEAAHIWFGGRSGLPRAHHYADDEGNFEGLLPREGIWRVEAQLPGRENAVYALRDIRVEAPAEAPFAEVELQLDGTFIGGEVQDEAGQPVPGATVTAASHGGRAVKLKVLSDREGRFELIGLPEGPVTVAASTAGALAKAERISLSEEQDASMVLVLRDRIEIQGKVVAASGVVAQAKGILIPHDSAYGFVSGLELRTSVDGGFSFTVPAGVKDISLALMPPGFAARLLRIRVQGDEPLILPVDQAGGALILDLAVPSDSVALGQPTLRKDRANVPVLVLRQVWAAIHDSRARPGEPLRLPMMEPGVYSLCPSFLAAETVCTSGTLAPGGELALSLARAGDTRGSANGGG